MNKIKPTHVTFKQAKSLFQKGFNSKVRGRYFIADKKPFEAGKLYLSDYDLESLQIYAPEQWQAERLYSKEDTIDFAHFYFNVEFNSTMQDCKTSEEIWDLWIQQRKKK